MELYPHQADGVQWLMRTPRGGLFDEQGLGKTAQAIVAADRVEARKILVVVPTVVAHNWKREFEMWSDRSVQVITSGRDSINADNYSVVIVTHGLLIRDSIHRQIVRNKWSVCIVDEAHAFKNHKAKRTRALYGINQIDSIIAHCERVWLLTGTPMPNNPTELWTHLRALAPQRIQKDNLERPMNWHEFRKNYCSLQPSSYGDGWKVVGSRNTADLRARMNGWLLRRRKADHLDLPAMRFGTTVLTAKKLPAELVKIEKQLDRKVAPDQLLSQLRDETEFSTWRRLCAMAKLEPFTEYLLDFLDSNPEKQAVVFVHHKDAVSYLSAELALHNHPFVTVVGDMTSEARTRAVKFFQNDKTTRVAICNIVAGGVGITLTAASDVFFLEQSFVPGENAQAADRCHRIGQTESVLCRFFSLAGSVDELCSEILARKTEMIREVIQ